MLIADVEKRKASDKSWLAGYSHFPKNYLKQEVWKTAVRNELPSSIPADNDQMQSWAISNGYRGADVGESWTTYRSAIEVMVNNRVREEKDLRATEAIAEVTRSMQAN